MAIRDALLPEFDHEMATTRRTFWNAFPKESPTGSPTRNR